MRADVESLFTNIPLQKTIDLCKIRRVNNSFSTNIYRKVTFSGTLLTFVSKDF